MRNYSRTYIIYYEWANTRGNHSGMAYLVRQLKNTLPQYIKLVKIPNGINSWPLKLQRIHFYLLLFFLKSILSKSDKVLFMEYLGNVSGNQTEMAIKLRERGVKNQFFGLVHLSGDNLLELYGSSQYIEEAAGAIDKILVFGSSLANFFFTLGLKQKVIQTFHYVDTDYYSPLPASEYDRLQVIHMGSLKRDFRSLQEIVAACPEIDFHICQGNNNLSTFFIEKDNVKLYGFLTEADLLKLMRACQVSLSILEDSVGSNVITTSLAVGLVNVLSDVGSVRDYCNENNTVFCKSAADFTSALNLLARDRILIKKLRLAAAKDAQEISLEKSVIVFYSLLKENE